jgi:ABC-2 type transport system ATP-binding protein
VQGVDLVVRSGEIFAFLGPNGAGKTTTVEIMEGYRQRDAGEVSVLGADPAQPTREWRERIGIVLQDSRVWPELTVRESVEQFAGYYRRPSRVADVIERVGLSEQAEVRAGKLSGGQQRRLEVATALVGQPELLFLDEPTTGFDPAARRAAWQMIASLRDLGTTIFLTTHYLDEAQFLADRVAIIANGSIVAEGGPNEIGRTGSPQTHITFRLPAGTAADALPPALRAVAAVDGDRVELRVGEPVEALHALTGWALEQGVELADLEVGRQSLEDVYLELVGAT